MPENHFDGWVAARYDDMSREMFDPAALHPTIDVLAELAGDGRVLEFGIGTGRIAIPLAARGVPVHGIELSREMVDRLRAKPEAAGIEVTIGDFADAEAPGTYGLVVLVFNTIMNLTSQDEQVRCVANAARHLEPGGHFVIEVLVPELRRLPAGERVVPFEVTARHLGFDEYTDFAAQQVTSHHYWVDGDTTEVRSMPFRYVWPSELDLMARLAGMVPVARWADWERRPFTDESTSHVSVWRVPDDGSTR